MKKLIAVIILMALLTAAFVSCGWNIEIREPEEVISGETSISGNEENSEKEEDKTEVSENISGNDNEIEKAESAIVGDCVFLEKIDSMSRDYIEFKDKIITYSVTGKIYAFDIATGEKLYEFYHGDQNGNAAFEISKTDEKEGFDYRLLWNDRIVYLSSDDPKAKEEFLLPEQITGTKIGYASYSLSGEKIIWQCQEGIRMMDMKTGEESLILDNAIINEKVRPLAEVANEGMWVSDTGEICAFENPRFICGGRKIVVTAVTWDAVYWMLALYDIESGEFEWVYSFNEMVNVDYPIADKYAVIGEKWINAETGNYKNFEAEDYVLFSSDGIEFIKVSWKDIEGTGMKVFTGNFETIEEGGEKIAEITKEDIWGNISAVTENYIVIRMFDVESQTENCCLIKYR